MSRHIDLNCDMGEGETDASAALDRELMRFISSCSIACGGHAGSEHTMRQRRRQHWMPDCELAHTHPIQIEKTSVASQCRFQKAHCPQR